MKAGILLSVRAKATRLPGKVLKPLAGSPTVTEHLLRRLAGAQQADMVILATSTDPRDAVLAEIAAGAGFASFRGSADDKLLRYRDAATDAGLDFVVVVDGDDPFVSVTHIDRIIAQAEQHGGDYIIVDGLPVGATGFGLSLDGLRRVCAGRGEENTEIWARLYLDNPDFRCIKLAEADPRWAQPDIRMTLDYPEDYAFFTTVADGLAAEGRDTAFENVMDYLAAHPETAEINRGVQEAYEAHLRRSAG
jgi:spore coat polysaccharide biosynthesis protein SpsF